MQKISFVFLLSTLTVLISCKKEKIYTLGIDVQSEFVNDSVEVFMDNEPLIIKRLTTNNLLGVCDLSLIHI